MAPWRDIKRKMRRDVHATMGVPAYFLARRGSSPLAITIRGPHTKRQMDVGALPGSDGWGEMADIQPRLIFSRLELTEQNIVLSKGTLVSVESGEAYSIGIVHPADDQWVAVDVIPLDPAEADGLPYPGDR